jgi:hypothetical protein
MIRRNTPAVHRHFEPQIRQLIRGVRRALREQLPRANELVYDNYNFVVIGYGPSDRPSHAILSIAADAHRVRLAFPYTGAKLPDPHHLPAGSGKHNRSIRLSAPELIGSPDVEALIPF